MFVGHLALALGAKKVEPDLPLGVAVAATFGLDLLWPVFLLAGLETVRVSPHDTAFTNLAFESYPWSHSLAMALLWSGLAAALTRRILGSARVGAAVGALVASHWVLDLLTHRPDLPLWPQGPRLGLGLWNSIGGTIVVEGALLIVGAALYIRGTEAKDKVGTWALYSLIALCTAIWITQPWSPPPPSAQAVALGALVLWLLPPWGRWADGHRTVRGATSLPRV